jgi:transcriptional regulator with XRE-family HTH domain
MADPKRPTYRAKRFGKWLRDLREAQGLSLEEVAERLKTALSEGSGSRRRISRSTINRLELGRYEIQADELTPLMDMYGVQDRRSRLQLRQLAEGVRLRGWHEGMVSDQDFADYVWAESNALAIDSFQLTYYPGQVQAAEYAEALVRHGEKDRSKAETETLLEVRLTRAELLGKSDAPAARFLLYEGVLRQRLRIFTREQYAAQFRHMLNVAEYPNVELRYLPIATDCSTLGDINAGFTILKMRDEWPTLVHVETPVGAVVGEDPGIDWAVDAFEALWNEGSQDEGRTIDFLTEMLREVEK